MLEFGSGVTVKGVVKGLVKKSMLATVTLVDFYLAGLDNALLESWRDCCILGLKDTWTDVEVGVKGVLKGMGSW